MSWILFSFYSLGLLFCDILCILRDDANVNVKVEFGVVVLIVVLVVAVVGVAVDFQFETGRLLETAPEVKAPDAAFVDHLETVQFVALDDFVFNVILCR